MATGGTNRLTLHLEVQDNGAVRVVRALREELEGLTRAARDANREVGNASTSTGRFSRTAGGAATSVRNFTANLGNAAQAMRNLNAAGGGGGANNLGNGMNRAATAGRGLSGVIRDLSIHTIALNAAWQITQSLAHAAAATFRTATAEGVKFQQHMADVSTLYYGYLDSAYAVASFGSAIKDMLGVVPKSADDLGASAYEIVQAGITDTAKALEILRRGVELGVAGMGSTKSAVDILTSAMNAYGFGVEAVSKLSNTLFLTVQYGKTTIDDLVESFGRAAPIAQAAGVRIEELSAATAAMTQAGMRTTDAQIYIRQTINALLKPTSTMQKLLERVAESHDEMGAATGRNLIKTFGFIGALMKLKDAAQGSDEVLTKAYGRIQANTLQLALTGSRLESYIFILDQMDTNTRALNDAYMKAGNTWGMAVDRLASAWDKVKITFFETFQDYGPPFIYALRDALEELTGEMDNLADPMLYIATEVLPTMLVGLMDLSIWAAENGPSLIRTLAAVGAGVAGASMAPGALKPVAAGLAGLGTWVGLKASDAIPDFSPETIESMRGLRDEAAFRLAGTSERTKRGAFDIRGQRGYVEKLAPWVDAQIGAGSSGPDSDMSMLPDSVAIKEYEVAMTEYVRLGGRLTKEMENYLTLFGIVPEQAKDVRREFMAIEGIGQTMEEDAADLKAYLKDIGESRSDEEDALKSVADRTREIFETEKQRGTNQERLNQLSNEAVTAERAVHQFNVGTLELKREAVQTELTARGGADKALQNSIKAITEEIALEQYRAENVGKTAIALEKANEAAAKASAKVDHKAEQEMWQARMDFAKSTVDLRKQDLEALTRTKAPLDEQRAAAAALDSAARGQLEVEMQILDYRIAQTNASGADASLISEKVKALLAEKAVLEQRAGTYADATNQLNESIDNSIEKITFDFPNAFREGMSEALTAVVSGTRKMSDVFEGLRASMIKKFVDGFIAIIIGKKSKLDDPMEKNMGSLDGLFGKTSGGMKDKFSGAFDFVSSLFRRDRISGVGPQGTPLMSAQNGYAQQQGGGGLMDMFGGMFGKMFGGGQNGGQSDGGPMSWFSNMFGKGRVSGVGPQGTPLMSAQNGSQGGGGFMSWFSGMFGGGAGAKGGSGGAGGAGGGMSGMASMGSGIVFSTIAGLVANKEKFTGTGPEKKIRTIGAQLSAMLPWPWNLISLGFSLGRPIDKKLGVSFGGGGNWGFLLGGPIGLLVEKILGWAGIKIPTILETLFGKKTKTDIAKKIIDKSITRILTEAFPDRWDTKSERKGIVTKGDAVRFSQRGEHGMGPGLITAQVLGLLMAGGISKKKNPFKGSELPTFRFADLAAGMIQGTFERFPDDVEEFSLAIAEGLAGSMANAIDTVQKASVRISREARQWDGYVTPEGERIDKNSSWLERYKAEKNYTETEAAAYDRMVAEDLLPSVEEAVIEIVRIFGQDLPRAIKKRFDDVISREFALEKRRREGTPEADEVVTVEGQQIARLLEIETEAFDELFKVLSSVGAKIKEDALSRRLTTELLATELRKVALEKSAEKIGGAFFSSASFDNILAPLLTTLERGVEEILNADSAKEAQTLMSNLLNGVGNDFKLIQKNLENLVPVMEAYARLVDDLTLALTSFKDVFQMADDAFDAVRKLKRGLMDDQAAILKAESLDAEAMLQRRLHALKKKTGIVLFDDDDKLIRRSRTEVEAIVKAMTDDELKRTPELLMTIANQIVSNANLQIRALEEQMKVAQEWANMNDSSRDAMLAVRQYGRPAGETAEAAFNLARTRFEKLVTQFRTGTDAEQLSAAQQIIQAGPALLELAQNAGFEPGSSVFELLRGGISAVLEDANRRAFDAQAEVLDIQKKIHRVQKEALDELTVINGFLAEAEKEALRRRETEVDWDPFIGPTGPVQQTADTAVATYGLLETGINVDDVGSGHWPGERPLSGSGGSSFRFESPRDVSGQGSRESLSFEMPITYVAPDDGVPETEKVRQMTRTILKALDDPRVRRKMRSVVSDKVAVNG